ARLAESEARRPELEIGADYWYSPRGEERHTYAAKVMVSLPWWNRARQAEARAALAELEAERGMRDAARLDAQGELADAAAAFEAARRSYLALDQGLLDQARWGLEATRTAFATGQGGLSALLESARLKLDLEIEQIRARARLDLARAWVERVSTQPIAAENCTATGGQP
ncbi:MAG TPA: TolC family protein, partial [Thermoanaerobaculia bacterium]|nr:TolC family protein [Thermoanaerobaculia bacterium]